MGWRNRFIGSVFLTPETFTNTGSVYTVYDLSYSILPIDLLGLYEEIPAKYSRRQFLGVGKLFWHTAGQAVVYATKTRIKQNATPQYII